MSKIKVGIVDDHESLRHAIIRLLKMEPEIEVSLTAENGIDLIDKLVNNQPDVILLDIRMPKMGGVEAASKVVKDYPSIKVIAHTQYDSELNIMELYELGARGFLAKGCDPAELIKAIKIVNGGGNYVTDNTIAIFKKYLKTGLKYGKVVSEIEDDLKKLTQIEIKILWHTSLLKSIKEIASDLNLSPHTVNNHQANIRRKLNQQGRNILSQFAINHKEKLKMILLSNEWTSS